MVISLGQMLDFMSPCFFFFLLENQKFGVEETSVDHP